MNGGHAAVALGDDYEAIQARLREAGHQVDDHEHYWGLTALLRAGGLNLVLGGDDELGPLWGTQFANTPARSPAAHNPSHPWLPQ
jgi:hypothetical protein